MTLTGEELVKIAAAPESLKGPLLAVLDGAKVEKDPLADTVTIGEIMGDFGKSRASVWRILRRGNIEPKMIYQGLKRYDARAVQEAFAYRGRIHHRGTEGTEKE